MKWVKINDTYYLGALKLHESCTDFIVNYSNNVILIKAPNLKMAKIKATQFARQCIINEINCLTRELKNLNK